MSEFDVSDFIFRQIHVSRKIDSDRHQLAYKLVYK